MINDVLWAITAFNCTLIVVSCFFMVRVAMARKKNEAKYAELKSRVNRYEDHIRAYGVCPPHFPTLLLINPLYRRNRMGRYTTCVRCYENQCNMVKKDGDGGVIHRFSLHVN